MAALEDNLASSQGQVILESLALCHMYAAYRL